MAAHPLGQRDRVDRTGEWGLCQGVVNHGQVHHPRPGVGRLQVVVPNGDARFIDAHQRQAADSAHDQRSGPLSRLTPKDRDEIGGFGVHVPALPGQDLAVVGGFRPDQPTGASPGLRAAGERIDHVGQAVADHQHGRRDARCLGDAGELLVHARSVIAVVLQDALAERDHVVASQPAAGLGHFIDAAGQTNLCELGDAFGELLAVCLSHLFGRSGQRYVLDRHRRLPLLVGPAKGHQSRRADRPRRIGSGG